MNKLFKTMRVTLSLVGMFSLSACEDDTSSKNIDNETSIASSDKSEVIEIESEMREKLNKLKKDFTQEQVHEIMGEPDEIPETSIYRELYYLDNNKIVRIYYLSDSITVDLIDTIDDKNKKIL
jgi:outer membrane protein assembly factor BamE (lipoprotein component of BamABCDE complex)